MKQRMSIAMFLFCLFLFGCTKPVSEGDFPFEQTWTQEAGMLLPMKTESVLPTSKPTETLTLTSVPYIPMDEGEDYFVYRVAGETDFVMLHLTGQDKQFEILSDLDVRNFSLNTRRQIAYAAYQNGNLEVYVDAYPFSGKSVRLILDEENSGTWFIHGAQTDNTWQ